MGYSYGHGYGYTWRGKRRGTAGAGVSKPVNVTAPVLSGTPTVGQVLSVTTGTWTNSPTSYDYEWYRNFVPISGTIGFNTYTLVSADLGLMIVAGVAAHNAGGWSNAIGSNALGPVAASVVGGAALLTGETDGFATDFTYATDASRVAVKTAGTVVSQGLDTFFTNAGTSPKQVFDASGALVWAPHNMCLQSQTLDNASWVKNQSTITANAIAAPDGTMTADASIPAANVTAHNNSQTITVLSGPTYTLSAYVKKGTLAFDWHRFSVINSGTHQTWFNLATGVKGSSAGSPVSSNITSVGNGWYRLDLTIVSATTSASCHLDTAPSDGSAGNVLGDGVSPAFYAWGMQFNRGYVPTAYLPTTTAARFGLAVDYDPVTHAAKGLLCEPAATNLQLNSANLSVWVPSTTVIALNDAVAPNGQMEAMKVTDDGIGGASSNCYVAYSASTISATTVYTYSFFAKAAGSSIIDIRTLNDDLAHTGTFDLSTQTFTPVANVTSGTFQALPNGWYRCAMTWTSGADTSIGVRIGFPNITKDGTHSFWMWGPQMELGTVATSRIPTFAASATRAVDQYNVLSASINHSATAGSWWADANFRIFLSGGRVIALSGSVTPIYQATATTLALFESTFLPRTVTSSAGQHKMASAFASGDRAFTADGLSIATDAGSTTVLLNPGALIYFGSQNGTNSMSGHIAKARYVPRRKSNAELVTETT